MEAFLNKDVSLNHLIAFQAILLNLHLGLMQKKKNICLTNVVIVIQFQCKFSFTSALSAKLRDPKQTGFLELTIAGLINLLLKVT